MIDENCIYCNREGECAKGLPGTPCEVAGCVARTKVGYLSWNEMTNKQKSDFLYELNHQPVTTLEAELAKGDLPVHRN